MGTLLASTFLSRVPVILLAAVFASMVVAQAPVTLVAQPALATSSLPPASARDGQFEATSIGNGFQTNLFWGLWQFGLASGIAHETSSIAAGNPPRPSGDYVAFISGQDAVKITVSGLSAGVWRLRYELAARNQAGVPDAVELSIKAVGQVVGQEQNLTIGYQPFATRPFFVSAGAATTFEFAAVGSAATIALLDNVVLEPIREWGVAGNWSPPVVPGSINPVQIPVGAVIAITSNATAASIDASGELLVPDVSCALTAGSVRVMGNTARLEVGRRQAPLAAGKVFTLTLTGPYTVTNSKFLMAMDGGTIEMHGAPKRSWTRLSATALPGSTSIQVADASGWNVGDEIVIAGSEGQAIPGIASTGFQDFSEQRTVAAINGNTIQLGPQPLAYLHVSSSQSYPTGGFPNWMLEQHAEVGMLTHNVKVTSVPVPVPGTSGNPETGFGGHIMIMGSATNPAGRGFLSAVELTRMGQTKQLGRYPMHWHMCRDGAAGQYIVESSIHETFNRACTIHGTDGILVDGNVGYHNLGHAFFLEDGSEEDNVLSNNLAIGTLKPAQSTNPVYDDAVIPSDNEFDQFQNRTPAAFWITNPRNTIVGNVASDTIGTGFWLIFSRQVLGLSNPATSGSIPHNQNDQPNKLDLTEFRDNIAHGCRQGLDVHDGIEFGTDHILPNVSWAPASGAATLKDFVAYSCDTGIYTGDGDSGGDLFFDHTIQADNIIAARFASGDFMKDALFVADSGNGLYTTHPVVPAGKELEAYRIYDGAAIVIDSHFAGYDVAASRLLGSNGASLRRTNHRLSNVTFEPMAVPRVEFEDFSLNPSGGTGSALDAQSPDDPRSWGFSVWDEAGSVTGAVGSIIGNHPWMQDGTEVPYVNATGVASRAYFTPRKFGHLYVREPGVGGLKLPDITFERIKTGQSTLKFLNDYRIDQQKQVPVILNGGYLYTLAWTNPSNGLPVSNPNQDEIRFRVGNLDPDDAVLLMLQIQKPGLVVTVGGVPVPSATSLAPLRQTPPGGGPLMFIDSAGNLYLRVMNPPASDFFELNW